MNNDNTETLAQKAEKLDHERRRPNFLIIGIIGILTVAGLGFGIYKIARSYIHNLKQSQDQLVYDSAAVEGGWKETDSAEVIAGLNEKISEGMINISMNTAPTFSSGSSAGNLMIVNEAVNTYPQIVEIIRDDNQETIYTSDAIPVGSKIESAKLDTDLDAGTYACTAFFYNVDPDTGERLGCAGAEITIKILS